MGRKKRRNLAHVLFFLTPTQKILIDFPAGFDSDLRCSACDVLACITSISPSPHSGSHIPVRGAILACGGHARTCARTRTCTHAASATLKRRQQTRLVLRLLAGAPCKFYMSAKLVCGMWLCGCVCVCVHAGVHVCVCARTGPSV